MKKSLLSGVLFLTVGCFSSPEVPDCPPINIPRETARTVQTDSVSDKFQITLSGYDASCYTDARNNRRYALVSPVFNVRRLENSPITTLDVDFFLKTKGNDTDYLGERVYNQQLSIEAGVREKKITGKQVSVRVAPQPYTGFSLELGLKSGEATSSRVKKMFDINYRYFTEEELARQNEKAVETKYLEVFSDEKVVYSDCDKEPKTVKKNAQTPCGN